MTVTTQNGIAWSVTGLQRNASTTNRWAANDSQQLIQGELRLAGLRSFGVPAGRNSFVRLIFVCLIKDAWSHDPRRGGFMLRSLSQIPKDSWSDINEIMLMRMERRTENPHRGQPASLRGASQTVPAL